MGLYGGYIGVTWGLYSGYIGIMEKKMETTIMENQMEKNMENEMDIGIIEHAEGQEENTCNSPTPFVRTTPSVLLASFLAMFSWQLEI